MKTCRPEQTVSLEKSSRSQARLCFEVSCCEGLTQLGSEATDNNVGWISLPLSCSQVAMYQCRINRWLQINRCTRLESVNINHCLCQYIVTLSSIDMSEEPRLEETMRFMAFAYSALDQDYNDTAVFVVSSPHGWTEHHVVVVSPDGAYTRLIDEQTASEEFGDALRVRGDVETFVGVYFQKIHPVSAVLSGKVSVQGMQYARLRKFCNAIDWSPDSWRRFQRHREAMMQPNFPSESASSFVSMRSFELFPCTYSNSYHCSQLRFGTSLRVIQTSLLFRRSVFSRRIIPVLPWTQERSHCFEKSDQERRYHAEGDQEDGLSYHFFGIPHAC